MDVIDVNYDRVVDTPSDIWEHLPVLCKYSLECSRIVEIGVRTAISTWAFLKGLSHNNSGVKQLICVDLEDIPSIETIISQAKAVGVDMRFIRGDSATIDLKACSRPTFLPLLDSDTYDMLFIDSWHVGGHLERELATHAHKIQKYIIMHDTESDGVNGESVRCGYNIAAQSKQYGYSEGSIRTGLTTTIQSFLSVHPEWSVKERFDHNNGLTILQRST